MRLPDLLIGGVALACCIGAATATSAQVEAERQVQRHAAVGETVRLRGHVNYSRCDAVIPTTITVTQAPRHGTLTIRDEAVTSGDPELGRGTKCKGSSGEGRVVYYTRTRPGTDNFGYDSSSRNGVVHVSVTIY